VFFGAKEKTVFFQRHPPLAVGSQGTKPGGLWVEGKLPGKAFASAKLAKTGELDKSGLDWRRFIRGG
jgi:hypothetical protein